MGKETPLRKLAAESLTGRVMLANSSGAAEFLLAHLSPPLSADPCVSRGPWCFC